MRVCLCFLVCLLPVGFACAAEIPRYDPEGYCKVVASFGGKYSAMLDNSCLELEQGAYNELKAGWGGYSGHAQSYCDDVATFGGKGSYQLLKSCIDLEEQAAGSKKKFEF